MGAVYEYIIGNNGTEAAATYPSQDVQYPCKFSSNRTVARIKSYGYIIGDEETVKRALAAIGPLSVGINGGIESFFNYWNGLYDDFTCSGNINHAVILVGYGTDNSFSPAKDYWIIKNSWGTSW
jgi:C1A family cysteine protease